MGPVWELAYKTGGGYRLSTQCRYIVYEGAMYFFTILTKGGESIQTLDAIGRIGKAVFDNMNH